MSDLKKVTRKEFEDLLLGIGIKPECIAPERELEITSADIDFLKDSGIGPI